MIIWRHAAPVRIATNVPSDLLAPEGGAPVKGTPRRRRSTTAADSTAVHSAQGGSRSASDETGLPPIDERTLALKKRMAYGVWYLPKEQWAQCAYAAGRGNQGGGNGQGKGNGNGGGGRRGDRDDAHGHEKGGDHDDSSEALADAIPKLYSSKIYKDFLKEKRIHRIPHYLNQVESPNKNS